MNFTPWLHRRSRLTVVVMGMIAMWPASRALAQVFPGPLPLDKGTVGLVPKTIGTSGQVYLPAIGGGGGGQFFAPCPPKQNLIGFEMRVGDDVDAISPACAKSVGPSDISGLRLTANHGLVGGGSQPNRPNGDLFAEQVTAPGWHGGPGGSYLRLLCGGETPIVIGLDVAAQGQRNVIVHNIHLFCGRAVAAQLATSNPSAVFDGNGAEHPNLVSRSERCPAGQVAVGMHGRSGAWLDAMGLICDAPTVWEVPAGPVKTIGRIKLPPGDTESQRSICDLAREARARNSPAASGLEARCTAVGEPPVKAIGRVKVPTPTDATSRSICDVGAEARARNSPAAPGLEAQCRANLAAIGAAIAEADPIVSDARAAEADALFKQGFDIATGIFGDPALGAQGHTATGPNSDRIRGFLGVAGQRGFDASVKLHLSRNYNP